MLFRYLYMQTGLNRFHSTDLDDMRRALLDEDQDGPDGGSADVTAWPARHQYRPSARAGKRRIGHRPFRVAKPRPGASA